VQAAAGVGVGQRLETTLSSHVALVARRQRVRPAAAGIAALAPLVGEHAGRAVPPAGGGFGPVRGERRPGTEGGDGGERGGGDARETHTDETALPQPDDAVTGEKWSVRPP